MPVSQDMKDMLDAMMVRQHAAAASVAMTDAECVNVARTQRLLDAIAAGREAEAESMAEGRRWHDRIVAERKFRNKRDRKASRIDRAPGHVVRPGRVAEPGWYGFMNPVLAGPVVVWRMTDAQRQEMLVRMAEVSHTATFGK